MVSIHFYLKKSHHDRKISKLDPSHFVFPFSTIIRRTTKRITKNMEKVANISFPFHPIALHKLDRDEFTKLLTKMKIIQESTPGRSWTPIFPFLPLPNVGKTRINLAGLNCGQH